MIIAGGSAYPRILDFPRFRQIADSVSVGPYSIIGENVELGEDCEVMSHVVLDGHTGMGQGNRIFPWAAIGLPPQDLKDQGEPTRLEVGDGNVFREFITVHRGTAEGGGATRIGSHNLLMAYVHIAHDCHIGDGVIMANGTQLAGHVTVEDCAVISGLVAVHQFGRIGEYAFLGACSAVLQDIPPYVKAQGNRAKPFGLNGVGLRRQGISVDTILALKEVYRIVFASGLNTSQALAEVEGRFSGSPEVRHFVEFIKRSTRGISK
jgi:UDP-N-acetylglucosamine acyltransferase